LAQAPLSSLQLAKAPHTTMFSRVFWVFFATFSIYTHQGCGSSDDDEPTKSATTVAATTVAPTTVAAAVSGDTPTEEAVAVTTEEPATVEDGEETLVDTGYGYGFGI